MSSYVKQLHKLASVDRLRAATGLGVVDVETFASFSGGPDLPGIYLVVETEAERHDALKHLQEIEAQVRNLLAAHGWPPEHARTALVNVASREQIKAFGRDNVFS